MPRCPHCTEKVVGYPELCPVCSQPLSVSSDGDDFYFDDADVENEGSMIEGPLASIARFSNAAEAGYFAHELTVTEELPAVVKVEEHFDALTGYWSNRFSLLVSEHSAQRAAVVLQSLVERSETEEIAEGETRRSVWTTAAEEDPFGDRETFGSESPADSGVNWIPIVLTLAAGSAVFWGVRNIQDRPQPRADAAPIGARHQDLWGRLSSSPEPWIQQRDGGRGTRSILIETDGDLVIIREDSDGDGVYEKEYRLQRKAVVR